VQLVAKRLGRKIGLLRPSFIAMSVNYAVALESHEPECSRVDAEDDQDVSLPEGFRPGRPNAASGSQDQEAARGTNRSWVSCFCSLAGPVVGCWLEEKQPTGDVSGQHTCWNEP